MGYPGPAGVRYTAHFIAADQETLRTDVPSVRTTRVEHTCSPTLHFTFVLNKVTTPLKLSNLLQGKKLKKIRLHINISVSLR